MSLASRLCFVTAIALLVLALVRMALPSKATPSQTGLIVELLEQEVGEVSVGVHAVAFTVRNMTAQPQQIIGMAED